MLLMSPVVLEPIIKMKTEILRSKQKVLNLNDVLLALSICAATNPVASLAVTELKKLKNCEAHASCMLTSADDGALLQPRSQRHLRGRISLVRPLLCLKVCCLSKMPLKNSFVKPS